MQGTRWPLIAIGLGLLLIALALAWPSLLGTTAWNQEHARERSQASAHYHQLVHEQHDAHGPQAGAKDDEFRAAKERYARADAQLHHARFLSGGLAAMLRWTGVLLLAVGTAAYWVARRGSAN